jgi:hypothetical protein
MLLVPNATIHNVASDFAWGWGCKSVRGLGVRVYGEPVWNIFPPFGTCLVIGIQRAGRRRSPTATGSGRGRMDRIGSADRYIPRTSRADRMHMNTDRVMSAIIL